MFSGKKVVVFDLDGTAVDSPRQKLPSARLKNAVKQLSKSYRLCAATGRPWSYASPVLQYLGLTEPCIISGGTQLCDPASGKVVWQSNLVARAVKHVAAILKAYPELGGLGCKALINDYDEHDHFNGGTLAHELELGQSVHMMTLVFVPDAIAPSLYAKLSSVPGISCSLAVAQATGCKDIHITIRDATKEHAVGRVLNLHGVGPEAAIGIGDGHNDLHLFNAVSHRVAMGNAVDELKSNADQVIGHVSDDGLATFFETFLLRRPMSSRTTEPEAVY